MTETRTTKTCSGCFEEIDVRAVVCPHCRSPQTRRRAWLRRHPVTTGLLAVLAFYAVLIPMAMLMEHATSFVSPRSDLEPFDRQVSVASSRMVFGQSKDGPVVSVIGMLKNDSDLAWKRVELEVQLYNSTGELIDVGTDRWQRYVSEIAPQGEIAFKMRLVAEFPVKDYASYKLFVRGATDARSFP